MTNPDSEVDDGEFEDEGPSPEELALIRAVTSEQTSAVDQMLLAACTTQWRKVAMVVGTTLDAYDAVCPDVPYVYLQLRLQDLVARSVLQSQGDIISMRHSEVRLAEPKGAA